MSTFVSVGNARQPFNRLIQAVVAAGSQLPSPIFIQFGSADIDRLGGCDGAAFLGMEEFSRRVSEAELCVFHAGAGSVIHAVRAGKCPVIMARRKEFGEHIDNHQVEFATELSNTGKVICCVDPDSLVQIAGEALARQSRTARTSASPEMVHLIENVFRRVIAKEN